MLTLLYNTLGSLNVVLSGKSIVAYEVLLSIKQVPDFLHSRIKPRFIEVRSVLYSSEGVMPDLGGKEV